MDGQTTTRILAVEPDAARRVILERLVREWVGGDVVVADSADAAISLMAEDRPDLILTSTLLHPADDSRLNAHLRAHPDTHGLPVLTVPPVVAADSDEPAPARRGLLSFGRRKAPQWPAYDQQALGTRIREALAAAHAAGRTLPVVRISQVQVSPYVQEPVLDEHLLRSLMHEAAEVRAERDPHDVPLTIDGSGSARSRAHRWGARDLPWLREIRLPWGLNVELVNISHSGLLVESGARLAPGTATVFSLEGPQKHLSVQARIVRSAIAAVRSTGVRYHSAVSFEHALADLGVPDSDSRSFSALTPDVLDEVLQRVRDEAERGAEPAALRATFEHELGRHVGAREVRVRTMPGIRKAGQDSLTFNVPTDDDSRVVLQATFEPRHSLQSDEYEWLKAAADKAAELLRLEDEYRYTLSAARLS